ncbi:hypothetical protein TREPR_0211 [Treponema primitia ZAS-2]|uniref:Uncharacterized protein n=1 Tax=Treponema primitia (strain ATCC BAA-887 / DSM 12427 / ZAS-2) TaxID=545694 RepID=F5YMB8_TREPZ|nr:hypothetical protein [Treponema primitia]AEF83761.1 hypothetical protein TREPR_0211 [Treponema primitia ZAS-2]
MDDIFCINRDDFIRKIRLFIGKNITNSGNSFRIFFVVFKLDPRPE